VVDLANNGLFIGRHRGWCIGDRPLPAINLSKEKVSYIHDTGRVVKSIHFGFPASPAGWQCG
jgi:hypothetical protein